MKLRDVGKITFAWSYGSRANVFQCQHHYCFHVPTFFMQCGPGGCLMELCIQLAIIMVGKQAMNTVLEMMFPLFFKWMNTLKVKTGISKDYSACKDCRPQWIKDFKLVEWGPRSLFPEYLEMGKLQFPVCKLYAYQK